MEGNSFQNDNNGICIVLQEVRSFWTSTKPEDYIMGLKTIGNTGFPEFIADSKTFIDDKSKSQIIRTQAIYSLRKIAAYVPETVSYLYLDLLFKLKKLYNN